MNSFTNSSKDDGLLPINHPTISLPTFQGPLDLLLFLIRKNEIDIYDIPIEEVTKQYLEILNKLQNIDLELTGDFFVLAATLMLIKSRMLLPAQNTPLEEDSESPEQDPRWELVQQLIEYKRLKEQAHALENLISHTHDIIPRIVLNQITPTTPITLKPSDPIQLWNSFNKVLYKLSKKILTGEIYEEQISVAEQMHFILETLSIRPKFLFSSLFSDKKMTLNSLLTSFLAILELTRLNKLYLEQTENFGDILCITRELSETQLHN
ncbi:MAG: chromosome segregation protein ScpA [Verrucomicrobia bacterium]|nr:MAG: chromosome segregation protein ScpA [Verrucomicrobiota bacterium]